MITPPRASPQRLGRRSRGEVVLATIARAASSRCGADASARALGSSLRSAHAATAQPSAAWRISSGAIARDARARLRDRRGSAAQRRDGRAERLADAPFDGVLARDALEIAHRHRVDAGTRGTIAPCFFAKRAIARAWRISSRARLLRAPHELRAARRATGARARAAGTRAHSSLRATPSTRTRRRTDRASPGAASPANFRPVQAAVTCTRRRSALRRASSRPR